MKLLYPAAILFSASLSEARGWLPSPKAKNYPARCLADEVVNSTDPSINKDDCLIQQQKCNMKSGTVLAKQTACENLNKRYPEIPKALNENQLHLLSEKAAQRQQKMAEKKLVKEEKVANRLANKGENKSAKNGKFMKRCADYRPNIGGDQHKFDTCNELIRLTQDIKKFCIVNAQNIDPTFEYDKLRRKKRSVSEDEDGEEEDDNLEDSEVEAAMDEPESLIVEISDEPANPSSVYNNSRPAGSRKSNVPRMHAFKG